MVPRTEIQLCESAIIQLNEVPEVILTLREAAAKQSLTGGQGFKKCKCKPAKNQCRTKRCVCFKENLLCNSRCHNSLSCCNK